MISIIIPVFNQAEYLSDAIDSALKQDCEVIVIDDGSTDGSGDIADSYRPKVKVIHQVNKGLASARNTGIMNATGEYVLPLDADDILMDNCVERIMEEIFKTKPDIIAPSFKCFGKENQEVILMKNPTLDDFKVANRIGYFSAIRKSCLLEIGGYNPKMIWGFEDYDLWFDLLKRGKKLVTINDVLVLYRTKEKSMITIANEHREELMEQIHTNHIDISW